MADTGRYALIIGNSQYNDKTLQQLVTPSQDAKALARVLEDKTIGNFEKVDVKLNDESYRLRREIERFFTKRKSTDTLLFYFSGHGLIDDYSGQLYLAVRDTEKDAPDSTTISSDFIYRNIGKCYAGKKVVILDCCYSGAITNDTRTKGSPPKVAMGEQFAGKGVVFLSASTAWQYAFQETDIKELTEEAQSLFTRFLVQGLETGGADLDGDGEIKISELYEYVFELVQKTTPNQTPEISISDQRGDIVIANNIKPKPSSVSNTLQQTETPVVQSQSQYPIFVEGLYQLALGYYQSEDWATVKRWLDEVVKEAPQYRDSTLLLKNAEKQLKLAEVYQQGRDAFEAKEWEKARERFQKVLEIDSDYKGVKDWYNQADKQVKLPQLYELVSVQMHTEQWREAIETLTELYDLDLHYRDVSFLLEEAKQKLEEARQKEIIEQEFQWASRQYDKAESTQQETDWQEAATLLQKVANKDSRYRTVGPKLSQAKRRLSFFDLYRKGKECFDHEKWEEAVSFLEQAYRLDGQHAELSSLLKAAREKLEAQKAAKHREMLKNYEIGDDYYQREEWKKALSYFEKAAAIEPNYADLQTKLGQIKKELQRQQFVRVLLAIVNLIIFTVLFAIFQNQIAKVGDTITNWWSGVTPTPALTVSTPTLEPISTETPTVTIPGVASVEVYLNETQINPDQPPLLTKGKEVQLKVIVIDTNSNNYGVDDLVCTWTISPSGVEDPAINTDLCSTLYTPSREFSSQTIMVQVEALERQFQSSEPISIKFDLTE